MTFRPAKAAAAAVTGTALLLALAACVPNNPTAETPGSTVLSVDSSALDAISAEM